MAETPGSAPSRTAPPTPLVEQSPQFGALPATDPTVASSPRPNDDFRQRALGSEVPRANTQYNATGARFESRGLPRRPLQDLYHLFMAGSWFNVLGLCLLAYISLNAVFAMLYWAQPGCVVNARPGSYGDAFWFSVQTFATIGFGVMSPATTYAHILVTLESFLGLFSLAVGTGIVFAKFSKPTARIGFSEVIIVTLHGRRPCLSFRATHQRRGSLIDVHARVSVLLDEVTAEGTILRRARELDLERSRMPMLALAWTLFHILDDTSPLQGLAAHNAEQKLAAIVVHVTGVDETTFETLHARHVYTLDSFRYDVRFVDMIDRSNADRLVVDHARLSQTVPLDRS